MRKYFVFFVLIPVIVLLVITFFFIDRWIEKGLERAGEELAGARVEIDDLELSLAPLHIQFERLEVASATDSMRNLFETGRVRYAMSLAQLLRGKTVIESMEVANLIIGTQRSSNGFLPHRRGYLLPDSGAGSYTAQMKELLQKTLRTTPLFDPALWRRSLNVDSLVKAQNFQTLALVDSLQREVAAAAAQWDSTVADFAAGQVRLEEIKTRLINIRPQELQTVDEIIAALKTVDDTRKMVGDLTRSFQDRAAGIRGDVQQLGASVAMLDDAVAQDVRQVLALARLPDFDAMGFAELFIGKKILSDAQVAAGWIDRGRILAKRYTPKPYFIKPLRYRGQDIHFPVERGYPRLWIKELGISGGTDRAQNPDYIYLEGSARNISSDQRITALPMTISLEGTRGGTLSLGLAASIDRRTALPRDAYHIKMAGLRLGAFTLGKADFLPATVPGAVVAADIAVTVPGTGFQVQGDLQLQALRLAFQQAPRNIGERLARDVLADVSGFAAGFKIWRMEGGSGASFSTDLDDQFAAGIKRVVGAELTAIQNQIRARVEKEIAAKRALFERTFAAKRAEVEGRLDAYKTLADDNLRTIEEKKKELEERLEQAKKGALDKAMDRLLKR